MFNQQKLKRLLSTFENAEGPVLSLYARIPPAARPSIKEHAKGALAQVDAPAALVERALAAFDELPHARTAAFFFGGKNGELMERVEMQAELPVTHERKGLVEARCQPSPWVLPLEMALGGSASTAICIVGSERCRVLRTTLGEIEEVFAEDRMPHEAFEVPSVPKQTPNPGDVAPARDDAHRDRQQQHEAEMRSRLHREVVDQLAADARERALDLILVVGTPDNVAAFTEVLPPNLAHRMVVSETGLPHPDVSPHEVLETLRSEVSKARMSLRTEILSEARESGVSGAAKVLEAAQQGRIRQVLVPWHLAGTAFRGKNGIFTAHEDKAREFSDGFEEVELMDALAELAPKFSIEVVGLRGELGQRVESDFGGIAATARW